MSPITSINKTCVSRKRMRPAHTPSLWFRDSSMHRWWGGHVIHSAQSNQRTFKINTWAIKLVLDFIYLSISVSAILFSAFHSESCEWYLRNGRTDEILSCSSFSDALSFLAFGCSGLVFSQPVCRRPLPGFDRLHGP